jgi:hypothetical protein
MDRIGLDGCLGWAFMFCVDSPHGREWNESGLVMYRVHGLVHVKCWAGFALLIRCVCLWFSLVSVSFIVSVEIV